MVKSETRQEELGSLMQKVFTLVGLLKYGLILSAILIYLPFTVLYQVPGHDVTGNMFVELSARGVFFGTIFLLATVWSLMFTEGLIINGHEYRFDKHKPFYRSLEYIKNHPSEYIPAAADRFFSIAVTGAQFFGFTVVLAGPSLYFFVSRADHWILALAAALAGFLFDYLLFIVACTPGAILNPGDPPLRNFPLAKTIWSAFGYEAKDKPNWAYRWFAALQQGISWLSPRHRLDQETRLIYPAHFQATIFLGVLLIFWIVFNWAAYPGRTFFSIESAPVVYIYASLLLFVGFFAVLDLNLGRLHISPIAALLIFVSVGYSIFSIDHEYGVTREESKIVWVTPVDAAKNSGPNLVVVASAGGGIWAAGWTTLALEKLIGERPQLAHEIRLLSTVSGGSVGAAYFVQGLLNDEKYRREGQLSPGTLHQISIKATSSSLEAVAYGVAFRDFPRLVTGGIYHPWLDRGYLLEREWARIAAGTVKEDSVEKGAEKKGECWADLKTCSFLHLGEPIGRGLIPAVIFNATVMESGQRIMITPLDFAPNEQGQRRGKTLSEFLFGNSKPGATANLPFWRAARLSATFSFVSPAVRAKVLESPAFRLKPAQPNHAAELHLVDGGYYDNFGIASALDWLQPVLEARRDGKENGLNFSRVLIVRLSGWAQKPAEEFSPSPGAKAALIGPLDALFAIRTGVAVSRNQIDVDRFIAYWNRELEGKVQLETVDFTPAKGQTRGPLSWHLSRADIANLRASWGETPVSGPETPAHWMPEVRKSWCKLANFLASAPKIQCDVVK